MTREEFDSLYLNKAVHCDTEEKANKFLALADSVGYTWWYSGKSLIEKNEWKTYEKVTCYLIIKSGIMLADTNYFLHYGYQIIEYQLQPKFKVGDKVRVNGTLFTTVNGKFGAIEEVNSLSPMSYAVKIDREWTLWFYEEQLEKVEEPTETIDDIIKEITSKLNEINILLNRLEKKRGVKGDNL